MVLPVTQEKRLFSRRKLTGLMPGKLIVVEKDLCISARPTDVSKTGLGVLSTDLIEEKSEMMFVIAKKKIKLTVLWRKEDFGKNNLYRYGLACNDADIDLEALFIETGCLK